MEVKLPPLEVEVNAALQGKLAYVSPTVRVGHPQLKMASAQPGLISQGAPLPPHRQTTYGSRNTIGTNHISPVQAAVSLAQPILLNAGQPLDVHR